MVDERQPDPDLSPSTRLIRGGVVFVLLLGIALVFVPWIIAATGKYDPMIGILSILVGLPFCIGAIGRLLFRLFRLAKGGSLVGVSFYTVLVVFLAGAVILREAIICVVMAAPFWAFSGWLGVVCMGLTVRRAPNRPRVNGAAFLLVPYAMLGAELYLQPSAQTYVISRAITIDAPPEAVRPLLKEMRDISPDEGRWNISQDLLGVPRPVSAVVTGETRLARWQNDVSFEERIDLDTGTEMRWRFAFPNDSISRHSDRHISPDSAHLRIETGGYRLEPLPGNRVRLTLDTTYTAQTPINAYAYLWGELILGDIQSNVLQIIKDRAERKPPRNTTYTVL
ncbi:SRPBCC family protein [Henriciella litoralis]|uniref:hypothetical protein n=1 Tax=Henriciella litoralis TaxID=568102 RepID=UPI00111C268A|nr:hypothetical protein [Henriciella litoralis]